MSDWQAKSNVLNALWYEYFLFFFFEHEYFLFMTLFSSYIRQKDVSDFVTLQTRAKSFILGLGVRAFGSGSGLRVGFGPSGRVRAGSFRVWLFSGPKYLDSIDT